MIRIALALALAAALAACGSGKPASRAAAGSTSPASAPASADPSPALAHAQARINAGLCKLVKLQLQTDATGPLTAKQAGLMIINAAVEGGVASISLKADVTAWALALSTDLSAGTATSPGAASALRKVARDCAPLGVPLR